METKYSKVFAKKLVALFLSVLMALSCFTGAISAYAASVQTDKDFHDNNLAANFMAWAETTDEQTAEALLDWADMHIEDLLSGLLGSSELKIYYNAVVITIDIHGYLDSIDGIFDLLKQVDSLVNSYQGVLGGDIKNINLGAVGRDLSPIDDASKTMSKCGKAYRAKYSAKELIVSLAKAIYFNSNDVDGKNVIGNFLKGSLNLGSILNGVLKKDVYDLLQDALGMWSGYKWNIVYNIVANLILENTKWFTDAELAAYRADIRATSESERTHAFNFDKVLVKALNEKLLDEIHAEITYPNYVKDDEGHWHNDSSVQRYKRICALMNKDKLDATIDQTSTAFRNAAIADANANHYTYDPSIIYFSNNTKDTAATADMDLDTGCVFLFQIRNNDNSVKKATLGLNNDGTISNENLYDFAFEALEYAWNTALKPTLGLIHVNYNVDRSEGAHGNHFDNNFFYWVTQQNDRTWDYEDWTSNYSAQNVEDWADAVYAESGCASAEEFLAVVRHTYEYDRSVVADAKNNWQDIDSSTLFNKLRYNPLADLYFNMQTGPINLYFEQTGINPVETFFSTAFDNYANMVAGLNDALVSATKILFLNSNNIGWGSQGEADYRKPAQNLTVPNMRTTRPENATGVTDVNIGDIADVLIKNVVNMFEYAANAADANILNPFYVANNKATKANNLTEANFEEAMIPLLIACIRNINMVKPIHDEKWDSCENAEGVAIVALEEYLSYVLPDKDYSVLWTYKTVRGQQYITAKQNQNLFENAVMPMCRDALGYIISSVVPCRKTDGSAWNVYETSPTDSTTIFEILNSVLCYYAGQDTYTDGTSTTTGKAVATLLGVVNSSNQPLVTSSNTLWKNLDNIINTLLPAIGTAQYGTTASYGKANSKQLIYYDLIEGILDIGTETSICDANGNVTGGSGRLGVTNLVTRLLTIITSEPVSANKATPYDSGSNAVEMIYNLVADVFNNLLGSRTDNRYEQVVPYSTYYASNSNGVNRLTPFDSLLTTKVLGHYSGMTDDNKDTGIIGVLVYNIYKAFGGTKDTTPTSGTFIIRNAGTNGCWIGAMFAVEAVNYFIPSFVPSLCDHTLNTATAKVDDASQSGQTASANFRDTTLDITNNSIGLNRFYRDADGNVQRQPRYFVYIRDIHQSSDTGAAVTIGDYDRVIAPEKTLRVPITGTTPSSATTYTFEITYDIFYGEMNGTTKPSYDPNNNDNKVVKALRSAEEEDGKYYFKCENLKTTAYMFVTTEVDWATTLYGTTGTYQQDSWIYNSRKIMANDSNKSNDYTNSAPGYGGSGTQLLSTMPNDFIVPMSDAQSIDNKQFFIYYISRTGSDHAIDGVFATLMTGDKYYAVDSNGNISDNLTTATASSNSNYAKRGISQERVGYAAIDPTNGDILNYERWDYTTDPEGKEWNRGPVIFDDFACGYSEDELNALPQSVRESGNFATRTHVCWELQDAIDHGIVYGVQREKGKYDTNTGKQNYIYQGVLLNLNSSYMQENKTVNGSTESVATKLLKGRENGTGSPYESISWGTPTPGIYFQAHKQKFSKGSDNWMKLLKYDGKTTLEPASYDMGVNVFTMSDNNMVHKIAMTIADDTGSTTLKKSYNEALATYSTYSLEDVTDDTAYTNMAQALKDAVKTISTPLNKANAKEIGSTMETVPATNDAYDDTGDKAYKPIKATTDIDPAIQANATKGVSTVDDTAYWYYNKECTIPVCSNTPLGDADVVTRNNKTFLKASQAMEVKKVGNVYYYVNAPQYEYAWDTTTYTTPYRAKTTTQKKNYKNELLFDRISFTCYDENGKAMDSRGAWTYTIADQKKVIKENGNGNDYRGLYTRQEDNLDYYLEQLKKNVDESVADIVYAGVSEDRKGMNSVNYDVASYEKMVQIAKDAEKLIWSEEIPETEAFYAWKKFNGKDIKVEVKKSADSTTINTLYEEINKNDGKYDAEARYKNEDVWREVDYKQVTDKALTQLKAGVLMYDQFKGYVQSRGYKGDKLEAEIACATNYAYTALDYTQTMGIITPDEGEPYEAVVDATITSSTATNAKYGTWKNGVLVNENEDGSQAYTTESWTNYVIALSEGIKTADEHTKAISGIYTDKTNIQKAENNLEVYEGEDEPNPPSDDTITVSGTVVVAKNTSFALAGGIVGIGFSYVDPTTNEVVALGDEYNTAANGTFSIPVPAGTTQIIVAGTTTIDRTVTLSGEANVTGVQIPVVICDYNHDKFINGLDTSKYFGALKGDYNVYMDITTDGFVNGLDTSAYFGFLGKTIVYPALSLD